MFAALVATESRQRPVFPSWRVAQVAAVDRQTGGVCVGGNGVEGLASG